MLKRAAILREFGVATTSTASMNAVIIVNADAVDATRASTMNAVKDGDGHEYKAGPPSGGCRGRPGIETDRFAVAETRASGVIELRQCAAA